MPIHEYECRDCNRTFEHFRRSNSDKAKCPGCGGPNVERKLSVFAAPQGAVKPCATPAAPCSGCCDRSASCPM